MNTIIIIIIDLKFKHIFSNEMIVYKNEAVFNTFNVIVIKFNNVFTNSENIIDLSKK